MGGGGRQNDTKGIQLYNNITENNIVILNDGTGTRLNPINLETSSIDLSLVSTLISSHCTWYVDKKYTHGSDHFIVNIILDWDGFANTCNKKCSYDMVSDNIQETTFFVVHY